VTKGQQKLNQVINENMGHCNYRSSSRERYSNPSLNSNLGRNHASYEENHSLDKINKNVNYSLPVMESRKSLNNNGGEKYDMPNWTTGIQKLKNIDSYSHTYPQKISESYSESSIYQILSRLDHLEARMNTTENKVRLSSELSQLKTTEK
jgi:hypothetical protein